MLGKMFGDSVYLKIMLLFYEKKGGYFANITGLANALDKSHVTIRKVVSDLVDAKILKEIDIGKSRVVKIDENGPYTRVIFDFFDSMKSINEKESIMGLIEKRSKEAASGRT
jgi:DNA-binding GntR family transcriptional regulator